MSWDVLAERYVLQRILGEGGMATIHLGHDERMGREVAVKLVAPDEPDEARAALLHEVSVMAQLDHPGVLPIYDFGEDGCGLFAVLPYVRGEDLRSRLEEGPLAPQTTFEIGIQVAEALAHCHLRRVVHRDLKPENILLTWEAGRVRAVLADFGIAIRNGVDSHRDKVIGTPCFLSPEQLRGDGADERSDVYMLGSVLYECVSGTLPYGACDLAAMYRAIVTPPKRLREVAPFPVDPELDTLVMVCLDHDPERRPAASHVAEGLRALLDRTRFRRAAKTVPSESSEPPRALADPARDELLGDWLLVRGEYEAAAQAFETARQARGSLPTPEENLHYLLRLATLAHKIGRYDKVLDHGRRALEIVDDHDGRGSTLAARTAAIAALGCTSAGRFAEAMVWLDEGERALDVGEAGAVTGDAREIRRAELSLLRSRGNVLVGRGDPIPAIVAYQRALELCDPEDDPWEHSIAVFNVGEACTRAGRYAQALDMLERSFVEKAALGDRWGLSYTYAMRAEIHYDRDELDASASDVREGLALALAIDDPKLASMHRSLLGRLALERGECAEASSLFAQALRGADACHAVPEIVAARVGLAAVHLARGQGVLGHRYASEALRQANQSGSRIDRARCSVVAAKLVAGRDDAEARAHVELARELAEATGCPFLTLDVALARIEVEEALGEDRAAERHDLARRATKAGAARVARRASSGRGSGSA